MTDSDGQTIRRIVWPGNPVQAEESLDHALDPGLVGSAIPGHRLFDGHRRVLGVGNTMLVESEQNHPAGMADRHPRRDIPPEKKLLHGRLVRSEA